MSIDDYFEQGLDVDRYYMLENDLLKFLDYVSLDFYKSRCERERIKSMYLADLLLRIGSNIDIFFHKYIQLSDESACIEIKTEKIDDTKWNWGDYKKLEEILELSNKYILVIPTGEKLYPFQEDGIKWNKITKEENFWWNSYNDVKHAAEFEKANLDNVIQALGGLLLLICNRIRPKKFFYYKYITLNPTHAKLLIQGLNPKGSPGRNLTHVLTKLFIYPYNSPY